MALPLWHYYHGQPNQSGIIRQKNSDFKVTENLGYEADGVGEHLFLLIKKEGINTTAVAQMIARWADVHIKNVSYAGLKDRHAITTQTFSVQLPGKESPELAALENAQLTVLASKRNSKKLRRGALKGNSFSLFIANMTLDDALEERLQLIKTCGVPNYFGEQRFGFQAGNLFSALEMFAGKKVKNRDKRSMFISAARSLIFNNVVSERIASAKHLAPMLGDAFILNGSKAGFTPPIIDDEISQRFASNDIVLSAPMWGKGEPKTHSDAQAFESNIAQQSALYCKGLEDCGLKQERRSLLLRPADMVWSQQDDGLKLEFSLPAGSYATSVMRELAVIKDATQRPVPSTNKD